MAYEKETHFQVCLWCMKAVIKIDLMRLAQNS